MVTVFDVANWFLAKAENVTNKKLQKLVYYAYSWYLVFNNESADNIENRFFPNKFEAWVHGCVYPELYVEFKKYGSDNIPPYTGEITDFSDDDTDTLNQVLSVYGKFNGNDLEDICHKESPWINARKGFLPRQPCHEPIKDKDIFECYSARLND